MELLIGALGAAAVLLGAGLNGALAALADKRRAEREATAAAEQREHDREERRYADRLDAFAAFEAAVIRELRAVEKFQEEHQGLFPGEVGFEREEIPALTDALARVQFLGSPPTEEAATELWDGIHEYVYGPLTYEDLQQRRVRFRAAARSDLGMPSSRGELAARPAGLPRARADRRAKPGD